MTKSHYRFFFIIIILNTYVPLMFQAIIQPNMTSGSGEVDFVIFAFLVIAAILDIRPNFTIRRPWSQVMLHVKFENCRSSCVIEDV